MPAAKATNDSLAILINLDAWKPFCKIHVMAIEDLLNELDYDSNALDVV